MAVVGAKVKRYSLNNTGDAFDPISNKLGAALRSRIRALGNFPVMSEKWCNMVSNLEQIATVSEMETMIPRATKDATLWEGDELALRFILEDGKLNLCLRSLIDFRKYQRDFNNKKDVVKTAKIMELMSSYETSMGLLLRNAWMHVEAVQTTDLPMLLQYCADVLADAIDHPSDVPAYNRTQEVMVLHYLYGLARHVDAIEESRLMPPIQERNIFMLVARHLSLNYQKLKEIDLIVGSECLARLYNTEELQTHKNDYIQSTEDRELILGLEDRFLDRLIADGENKRAVRGLLDCIKECDRRLKK